MALPGSRLLAFASRWFDATTVARVFEPLVADWQREWRDAPPGRQAWVRVRGGCGFAIAAITVAPSVLLLTQLPAATTRRVLARVIIFTATLSALLTVPFVVDFRHMPAERAEW